jgi:hypothetical protein
LIEKTLEFQLKILEQDSMKFEYENKYTQAVEQLATL